MRNDCIRYYDRHGKHVEPHKTPDVLLAGEELIDHKVHHQNKPHSRQDKFERYHRHRRRNAGDYKPYETKYDGHSKRMAHKVASLPMSEDQLQDV